MKSMTTFVPFLMGTSPILALPERETVKLCMVADSVLYAVLSVLRSEMIECVCKYEPYRDLRTQR